MKLPLFARLLVTVAIAVSAYLLLLALAPDLDNSTPIWQRFGIVASALTCFAASLRAFTIVFGARP